VRFRVATALVLAALAAGCGGGPPSPESVVRAWSESLNTGDNEAAADLFAPAAQVIQGRRFVLETRSDAVAFNESLPCSGKIVSIETRGDTVTARFLLGDRPESRCDSPGAEVRASFRVRDGKIVLWRQLPGSRRPGTTV